MGNARFAGSESLQAPLRLQLLAPASTGAIGILVGIRAVGDNSLGSASRPVVTRPSTIGVGNNSPPEIRGSASTVPRCTFLTAYSTAPFTPILTTGSYNLPIEVSWQVDTEEGIVVGGQGVDTALLLFAAASGGHTWTGEMVWEEP